MLEGEQLTRVGPAWVSQPILVGLTLDTGQRWVRGEELRYEGSGVLAEGVPASLSVRRGPQDLGSGDMFILNVPPVRLLQGHEGRWCESQLHGPWAAPDSRALQD